MHTKAFLSIDLDYWSDHPTDRSCVLFFNKVTELGLPITVVESHEEMLPLINKSCCNTVYNVDYHSDISGFRDSYEQMVWMDKNPHPDEGQWGQFIKWRKEGCFWWMYPWKDCYGCGIGGSGTCWCSRRENPFVGGWTDWKYTRHCKGTAPIEWGAIYKIAVCLSPGWYTRRTVYRALDALELDWVNENSNEFCGYTIQGEEFQRNWANVKAGR